MQFYSITDRGKHREINEDSCLAKTINEYTLLILADGMGGHHGGETASSKAIEVVAEMIEEKLAQKMLPGQIMLLLSDALRKANEEIIAISKIDESLSGMGTTCDICLVFKNTAYIAHIGDSRVYKIPKNHKSMVKLTKDHSLVEYMIETGAITEEEAANHPQKNIILRALGSAGEVNADIFHEKLSPGDVLLMCSDGLTNMVSEEVVFETVSSEASLENCGKKLVELANEAGGKDNITVVIYGGKSYGN